MLDPVASFPIYGSTMLECSVRTTSMPAQQSSARLGLAAKGLPTPKKVGSTLWTSGSGFSLRALASGLGAKPRTGNCNTQGFKPSHLSNQVCGCHHVPPHIGTWGNQRHTCWASGGFRSSLFGGLGLPPHLPNCPTRACGALEAGHLSGEFGH